MTKNLNATWSFSAGERGINRVRVAERSPGGTIFAAVTDPRTKRLIRRSLGHDDRERAKAYAEEQAAKIRKGVDDLTAGRVRLAAILDVYVTEVAPDRKNDQQRKRDDQHLDMWVNYLGANKDPTTITPADWSRFKRDRTSGAIDGRGRSVARSERRTVGPQTVLAALMWLRGALNWACAAIGPNGRPLLSRNPTDTDKKRSYKLPKEKNPARPLATIEQYEAVRSNAHRMTTRLGEDTYLVPLLDLAYHTGRRITPIRLLRYSDFKLKRTEKRPYGAIHWRPQNDKQGNAGTVAINADVRATLDAIMESRPGLGDAWVFPHPEKPDEPVTYWMASHWLVHVAGLAGLELPARWGWHSFRRGWATARKHMPAADVADAGGWLGPHTLEAVYQQADEETTLAVVLSPAHISDRVTTG